MTENRVWVARVVPHPVLGFAPPVPKVHIPRTKLQTWFLDADAKEIAGACYVTVRSK